MSGVAAAFFEQAVAPPQRPLELSHPAPMVRVDRQHEAVEEPPPLARRTREQRIHRRRQPDDPDVVAEGARGGDRRPIDAVLPLAAAFGRGPTAAELARLAALLHFDRNGEAAGAAHARAFGKLRPSQAPARGEQRQGLEEIGLAGAVLAA